MNELTACGIVVAGHGVASGRAGDPRFPGGTIELQIPVFRARGVDFARLLRAEPFVGTINIDISSLTPEVLRPEIALADVTWSPQAPPENFWFFRIMLSHCDQRYDALIYMPDPATKPEHFQPANVIEIIAPPIMGIEVGTRVTIGVEPGFIRFVPRKRGTAHR